MGKVSEKVDYLHGLLKQAGCLHKQAQTITHKKLDAAQPIIGDTMQNETENGTQGKYASDPAVDAAIDGFVEPTPAKVEGPDCKPAASVLAATGTSVNDMTPSGKPTGTPSAVVKSAALQQKLRACVESEMKKQAAYKAQAEEANFTTATAVMNKIAALNTVQTQEDFEALTSDIAVDFQKLANYNPMFSIACDAVRMRKMAAEIEALAEAEGIEPGQAAAALDEAIANDPQAAAEMENQIEGEALSDLAEAEQEQASVMDGLSEVAANASNILGQEVTPEDIAAAIEDTVAQAEQLGVEPEELIMAAAQQLLEAQEGGEPSSEEDMANAEMLLEEAAKEGVSPEEVIEGLATELDSPAAQEQELPQQQVAAMEKEACLRKLASTRRGANLARILAAAGR